MSDESVWWALGALAVGGLAIVGGRKVLTLQGVPAHVKGLRVSRRDRAQGVDVRLLAFLDWWEAHGPFAILVLPDGGVRTDEAKQLALFQKGSTRAQTLRDTPHGHAGAIDVAPWDGERVLWECLAGFREVGRLAKLRGLVWGGDWKNFFDGPHIEVPDWRSLPMPRTGPVVVS